MRSTGMGPATGSSRGLLALLALATAAGVIAGLASWAWGERWYDYHQPSSKAMNEPYDHTQLLIEQSAADAKNAAIAFGGLGVSLGLALGLAGGLAGRSAARAAIASTAGAVLAGALSAGAAYLLTPIYLKHQDPGATDLILPLVMHGTMGCAAALGAGLAFGYGVKGPRQAILTMIGGLIGAAIGVMAFELIAAMLYPADRTTQIISPTARTRLLARMLLAVPTAIGAALVLRGEKSGPGGSVMEKPASTADV